MHGRRTPLHEHHSKATPSCFCIATRSKKACTRSVTARICDQLSNRPCRDDALSDLAALASLPAHVSHWHRRSYILPTIHATRNSKDTLHLLSSPLQDLRTAETHLVEPPTKTSAQCSYRPFGSSDAAYFDLGRVCFAWRPQHMHTSGSGAAQLLGPFGSSDAAWFAAPGKMCALRSTWFAFYFSNKICRVVGPQSCGAASKMSVQGSFEALRFVRRLGV
ncbi:uncharacterized protein EV422DRAFT_170231 [Fimicolochytrium jonesii]|uniref:uncharacterized protein n=1 Tax=Fimicolochytrium jonesii TaxID=1396493 RepID=UPI0022FDB3CE|nr:uncharacterized protein EV422DRAFT_170231 [Fimicolochytrium jonesii]KAI8818510.1 hypothetical protein EV422DRAFT_170231 [Fimicolochytrium jonesii]